MSKTGKLDRDRLAAWMIVGVVHVLLGWGLTRLLAVKGTAAPANSVLQLVWIPIPVAPMVAPVGASAIRDATDPDATRSPLSDDVAIARAEASGPATTAPPASHVKDSAGALSATFVDQAAQWARQQAPIEFERADPLARPVAKLPGRPTRLQLAESLTVADAVGVIGGWFGGRGYTTDPCPELRKDVNDLSLAGDSAGLQDALYHEKRGCW